MPSLDVPRSRNARFNRDEKLCFRRFPSPSYECPHKVDRFWQTTGSMRQALSESGLHTLPRGKGDFWCRGEFLQPLQPREAADDHLRRRGPHTSAEAMAGKTE